MMKRSLDSSIIDCWKVLTGISYYYPDFNSWYNNRVIPDLYKGTRQLSVVKDSNKIVAVGIAKKYEDEKKICTIWVHPNHRYKGYGTKVINQSLDYLETRKPLLTIPYEIKRSFLPLIGKYKFKETQSIKGLYRPNAIELVYNGFIETTGNLNDSSNFSLSGHG